MYSPRYNVLTSPLSNLKITTTNKCKSEILVVHDLSGLYFSHIRQGNKSLFRIFGLCVYCVYISRCAFYGRFSYEPEICRLKATVPLFLILIALTTCWFHLYKTCIQQKYLPNQSIKLTSRFVLSKSFEMCVCIENYQLDKLFNWAKYAGVDL